MTCSGDPSRQAPARRAGCTCGGSRSVTAPSAFTLRATPGVRVVPLHAPLELGDVSSRLRVIDATLEGSTYTLRVEGRRGRSYQVRLLGPGVLSVQGATLLAPPAGAAARPDGESAPHRHAAGRRGGRRRGPQAQRLGGGDGEGHAAPAVTCGWRVSIVRSKKPEGH